MNDLKQRTKQFAVDVLRFCAKLPSQAEHQMMRHQLMRSGSSVGANYRAVCRAKSTADMLNKLTVVEEEADESAFWLECLQAIGLDNAERQRLEKEASELTAIMVSSKKTLRTNSSLRQRDTE
ncbi:MAG: four helix bundle protein [Verrucomicrobia bacterium]|nr:four helix bundle protein [Verrucomicrobiota bacterium]